MTVYVDEFRRYGPTAIACFRKGSSHLTADTVEELHAFAESIGLRRVWFQDARVPHYDLTRSRRDMAIVAGAVFVPAKQQARERIAKRHEVTEPPGIAPDMRDHGGSRRTGEGSDR